MKKIIVIGISILLNACAITPTKTGYALFTDVKESEMVTGEAGSKTGKACARNIFGIYATGDSSLAAAKKAGGIKKISTVDTEIAGILMLYSSRCTIVTGESKSKKK